MYLIKFHKIYRWLHIWWYSMANIQQLCHFFQNKLLPQLLNHHYHCWPVYMTVDVFFLMDMVVDIAFDIFLFFITNKICREIWSISLYCIYCGSYGGGCILLTTSFFSHQYNLHVVLDVVFERLLFYPKLFAAVVWRILRDIVIDTTWT